MKSLLGLEVGGFGRLYIDLGGGGERHDGADTGYEFDRPVGRFLRPSPLSTRPLVLGPHWLLKFWQANVLVVMFLKSQKSLNICI